MTAPEISFYTNAAGVDTVSDHAPAIQEGDRIWINGLPYIAGAPIADPENPYAIKLTVTAEIEGVELVQ
jgi:hypothetical protein